MHNYSQYIIFMQKQQLSIDNDSPIREKTSYLFKVLVIKIIYSYHFIPCIVLKLFRGSER